MALYTNTMRFTGLSGIDTESMVTALMKAEGMKLDKLKQQNQITLWKQTSYYNAADIFKTFQNNFLALTGPNSVNSARLSSTFQRNANSVKTSAGVDSTAIKVTSSANAEVGKYTIDVKQLATKDTYTGAAGSVKGSIASTVDWNSGAVYDNLKDGDTLNVSLDDTSKALKFTAQEIASLKASPNKGEAFGNLIQGKLTAAFGTETIGNTASPKVSAQVDGDGKLTISTNQGHTVSIDSATIRDTSVTAGAGMDLTKLNFGDEMAEGYKGTDFTLNVKNQDGTDVPLTVTLKSDMTEEQVTAAINKAIGSAKEPKIDSGLKASVVAGSDGAKSIKFSVGTTNTAVAVSGELMGALGFSGAFGIEATNSINDFGFAKGASTKLNVKQTLNEAFGVDATQLNFTINGKVFNDFKPETTIQEMMNKINSSGIGVKMSYDSLKEGFKLESVNTGASNAIKFEGDLGFLKDNLKLGYVDDPTNAARPADMIAKDSRFVFNGVETTRDSNNVDIAGIRMELTQITSGKDADGKDIELNGGPVSITVEKDVSGTVDFIKNFVEAYNTMIDSLNKELTTNRPKKDSYNYYEPLTDAQKESMKDNDIKNWEEKAQQGMLYNDDLLQKISTNLRGMLYQPVELSNGTKLSLYEIGITTSTDYREGGKLVIDEAKLTKAIESHGSDIAELFTASSAIAYKPGITDKNRIAGEGIAERINDIINSTIGTSGSITKRAGMKGDTMLEMSSTMYRTLKDQTDRMADMLKYLQNKETSYYQMFSRMEQAVTAANNQMSYLQAQLGF